MGDKKERPILFSGPMVQAVLRDVDPKTQTRRLVKEEPTMVHEGKPYRPQRYASERYVIGGPFGRTPHTPIDCPYGAPGDRLWVRETSILPVFDDDPVQVVYAADHANPEIARAEIQEGADGDVRWRPSIHMPRWASRIDLEVTAARVERLRDITEEDAKAEGLAGCLSYERTATDDSDCLWCHRPESTHFPRLWDAINGDRASWSSNPWVWVVSFKRVRP